MSECKYKGKYPMTFKHRCLGIDSQGQAHDEVQEFMYLGHVRLDITGMDDKQIEYEVRKLELMGMTR